MIPKEHWGKGFRFRFPLPQLLLGQPRLDPKLFDFLSQFHIFPSSKGVCRDHSLMIQPSPRENNNRNRHVGSLQKWFPAIFGFRDKKRADAFASALCGFGDPYGNRTHVTAVKGRCLNRLTNGPGSGNLIRTDDIPGMNRLLYQLSYAAIWSTQFRHRRNSFCIISDAFNFVNPFFEFFQKFLAMLSMR